MIVDDATSLNLLDIAVFCKKASYISYIQIIAKCIHTLTNRTKILIGLRLDHCKSQDFIIKANKSSFSSVIYDDSGKKKFRPFIHTFRLDKNSL